MIRKHNPSTTSASSHKRRRRCLTIEEKINLLDRLKAGARPLALSRQYDVSESAIRSLLRSERQLRDYAANCSVDVYRSSTYIPRDFTLSKTEEMLHSWYEEQQALGEPLTIASICAKARELYASLKTNEKYAENDSPAERETDQDDEEEEEREFKASKGWFLKFRKRYKLDFRSIYEAEPLDSAAASKYPAAFAAKVREGNFQPQQVFSAAQFTLPWKQMPERSSIAQRDKLTERISLLLCGNAQGDFNVKPLLVNRTLSPFCLRACNPADLPVFWRARPRDCQRAPKVTPTHFHEWLEECFVPAVRDYLDIMELPMRCLLLVDAELLQQTPLPPYDEEFVQLELLPANTAPLLQPITRGVVPNFKCNYLRAVFAYFLSCSEVQPEQSLYKIWRNFSISDAIDIIQEAVEEVSSSCWNGGWQKVWKEMVHEGPSSSAITYQVQRIVDVGRHLPGAGFADMTMDDIQKLLKLTNEAEVKQNDTFEMLKNDTKREDDAYNCRESNASDLMDSSGESDDQIIETEATTSSNADKERNMRPPNKVQIINKAFRLSKELESTLAELGQDNREQHLKFVNDLHVLMQPYKELKEQLLQPSIRDYFK